MEWERKVKLNGKQMMCIKNAVGSNGTPNYYYIKVVQTKNGYLVKTRDELAAKVDGNTKEAVIFDNEAFEAALEYWNEE